MVLTPIEPAEIQLVAGWLAAPENYQWLDFGAGRQILPATSLKIMSQRDIHLLRLFRLNPGGSPLGMVALSDVDRIFRSARLWYLLGEKGHGGQGLTTLAVSRLLDVAFSDLELRAVNAWVVEHNVASIRVLEHNNFRPIGRQRKCHYIEDRVFDRLLFDLLAEEHQPLRNGR